MVGNSLKLCNHSYALILITLSEEGVSLYTLEMLREIQQFIVYLANIHVLYEW